LLSTDAVCHHLDNIFAPWVRNLSSILENQLKGQYELKAIAVSQQPLVEVKENITALTGKMLLLPCKRIIGDMQDGAEVLAGLNLDRGLSAGNRPVMKTKCSVWLKMARAFLRHGNA
jgi:hypothetical protein